MMKQEPGTQECDTGIEAEFFREIAKEMLEEVYFDFKSFNTRQFLDKIWETYAQAQMKEEDALAIAVRISTRGRVRREIRPETMSAVAEKEHL